MPDKLYMTSFMPDGRVLRAGEVPARSAGEGRSLEIATMADAAPRLACRSTRGVDRLAVKVAVLPPAEIELWERRLNRHFLACGCETGGLAALAVAIGLASWFVILPGTMLPGWRGPATAGGLLIGAAAIGKAIGMVVARIRLARALLQLRRRLAPLRAESFPS